jgi:hypothetical protein
LFGLVAAVLLGLAYVVSAVARPACEAANGFLSSLHAGDAAGARAHATADMIRWLEVLTSDVPASIRDSEQGRTLIRLRNSKLRALTSGQLTAGLYAGCFTSDLDDGKPVFIVVRKADGNWRVHDVRSETQPTVCGSDP